MSWLLVAQRALTVPGWAKDALWRRAQAVPSLDLRFADNKSLVDSVTGQQLVTFTRASSGRFVDSAGVLQTATTNLLLRSEEFDNASWTKTNSSVTQNAVNAPNGILAADKLIESATTGFHYANQAATVISGAAITTSVYAKSAERSRLGVFPYSSASGARFNLANGTVISQDSGVTATITPVGDGWYRCSASITAPGTSASPWLLTVNNANATTYTGDGTSGLFLWGAQLEQASTVGEYIPTTSAINSAPRFDHNPTTGESLGLLVEEQRANSIRNNTMVGAVAGTPGTLPTNWSVFTTLTGLTRQIVGTGTEDGITYIDVRLSGTPNTAGSYFLQTETNTSVNASNGQTWTSSAYVRLTAGSLSGVSTIRLSTSSRDALGNVIASGDTIFTPTSAALITQRFASAYTNVSALTAFELLNFAFALSGTAVDFTLRIGLPQLEQGAFATSVIPTTTAAATRSADVASITGSAFSSWCRQDEGTLFAEASSYMGSAAVSRGVVSIDGTGGDVHRIFRQSDLQPVIQTIVGGVEQSTLGFGATWSTAASRRISYAYAVNNFGGSVDGGTTQTDVSGTLPTTSTLNIGTISGGNQFGGTIKRLTFWPQRLANSVLQNITQ